MAMTANSDNAREASTQGITSGTWARSNQARKNRGGWYIWLRINNNTPTMMSAIVMLICMATGSIFADGCMPISSRTGDVYKISWPIITRRMDKKEKRPRIRLTLTLSSSFTGWTSSGVSLTGCSFIKSPRVCHQNREWRY